MTGLDSAPQLVMIIPTYNERENLGRLVPEVLAIDPGIQVVIVDDASPDGTGQVADDLAAQFPGRVHPVHRLRKDGLARAYIAGFERALAMNPEFIGMMDADFSHDPADLRKLVAASRDADVVVGSRYVSGGNTVGWPAHRLLLSRFGSFYSRTLLGVDIRDLTGGFRIFRTDALRRYDLSAIRADGYGFQIELNAVAARGGLRVVEVPITFADRVAGKSKLSRKIILEAMVIVPKLRLAGVPGLKP